MTRLHRSFAALLAASLGTAGTAAAQSPMLNPGDHNAVWFQVQHPDRLANGFYDGSAWLADAGLSFALSPATRLFVSLPFVYATSSPDHKSTLLGNPYVGIREQHALSYFEFGGRLPLSGDETFPALVGLAADFDQAEAYLPHAATVRAGLGTTSLADNADGPFVRGRFGASVWIPTKSGGTTQVMGDYAGFVGYRSGTLEVDGGVTGRLIVNNAEGMNLGERTVHQAVIGATYRMPHARPMLFVRLPLDRDAKDMYTSVFGLGVAMDLR